MPLCAQPCPHQGTDTSKKDHVFAQFCCHSSGLKMVHDAQKIRSPKWRYSPIEAFCRGIPSPITSSIYLKSMVNKVPKQKIEETKKPKMSLNHGFCLPHIWPAKKGNPPAQAWRVLKPPRSWGFLDQIYGSCMLMYCITSLLNHMPFCCRKKNMRLLRTESPALLQASLQVILFVAHPHSKRILQLRSCILRFGKIQ